MKENPWEEAASDSSKPRKLRVSTHRPPYLSYLAVTLVFFWSIAHFYVLCVMVGTPLASSVFFIVLINLLFLIHYIVLLVTKIGKWRDEQRK